MVYGVHSRSLIQQSFTCHTLPSTSYGEGAYARQYDDCAAPITTTACCAHVALCLGMAYDHERRVRPRLIDLHHSSCLDHHGGLFNITDPVLPVPVQVECCRMYRFRAVSNSPLSFVSGCHSAAESRRRFPTYPLVCPHHVMCDGQKGADMSLSYLWSVFLASLKVWRRRTSRGFAASKDCSTL